MLSDEVQVDSITATLRAGQPVRVRLYGTSMRPTVLPGAVVPIEPVRPEQCRLGDVVLVRRGNVLAAHRWMGGKPGAWILQGDAFDEPDPPVTDEQVLGRSSALLVGKWAVPMPISAQRPIAQGILRVLPAFRASSRLAHNVGRMVVRRAQRAFWLRPFRQRIQRPRIVRLRAEHLPEVRTLLLRRAQRPTRATLAHWERLANSEREAAFIARHRGRIVGHASVYIPSTDPSVGMCGYLWVDRWYRGIGLATELERCVLEHARAHGYRELRARARWGSDSMRAFQRLGFRATREDDPAWAALSLSLE